MNYLNLNVSKTKEVIWDFRRHPTPAAPVSVNNMPVEVVKDYKYLGLTIDKDLSFTQHVKTQVKKANKKLYCIRNMRNLKVERDIITLFYNATVPSVLMYAGVAFYGMLTLGLK
jgi:hypothetical protein